MSEVNIKNKQNIYDFGKRIYGNTTDTIDSLLEEYYHEDTVWHGPHPLKTLRGREELSEKFWKPFLRSFPDVEKNDYILFGGRSKGADPKRWEEWVQTLDRVDEDSISHYFGKDEYEDWVHTCGNFVGTFENDFLDIPATKRPVWIRYGEFHKMVDGKVAETIVVIDLLDLMRQAGIRFYPSTSQEIIVPGPSTLNGIQLGEFDPEESQKTVQLHEDMIFKGLHKYKKGADSSVMNLETYWHKDFMYYAPCGIGPTRGIKGFREFHQQPWLVSWPDRKGAQHEARFGEGMFSCSGGPVKMTHTGSEWLGLPATNKCITIRAMDTYRREGDKIAENWLFLDIIDLLLQLDIDVFDRLRRGKYTI